MQTFRFNLRTSTSKSGEQWRNLFIFVSSLFKGQKVNGQSAAQLHTPHPSVYYSLIISVTRRRKGLCLTPSMAFAVGISHNVKSKELWLPVKAAIIMLKNQNKPSTEITTTLRSQINFFSFFERKRTLELRNMKRSERDPRWKQNNWEEVKTSAVKIFSFSLKLNIGTVRHLIFSDMQG